MTRINDTSNFVPRINQLDAATLDDELFSMFHNKLTQAFKYFLRNPLDFIGPEMEIILRFIVWRYSVIDKQASVGQSLLGIKYDADPRKLKILACLDILGQYAIKRQQWLTKLLPMSEETSDYIFNRISFVSRIAQIGTSLMFLRQGFYPSLPLLMLNIKPVSTIKESRSVGYSYMSRELLWSTFTDLLMFLVPLVNASRLRILLGQKIHLYMASRRSQQGAAPSPSYQALDTNIGVWECGQCAVSPVIPTRPSCCGHLYCHSCIHAIERCVVCHEEIDKEQLNYLA